MLLSLIDALRKDGIESVAITLREGWLTEQLDAKGIRRHLVSSPSSLDFRLPFKISQIIKSEGAHLVHSHLLDSNFYASIAAKIARVPHVGTEHGDVHHTKKKRFAKLKLLCSQLCGTRFTAVSSFTNNKLHDLGVSKKRSQVLPNPVVMPPDLSPEERRKLRSEFCGYDFEESAWLWIHVANLRPVKNQQLLIRAFQIAKEKSQVSQRFLIVGDGPEREGLENLAKELGVEGDIHFIGFRNDVPSCLAASDGFLLSSLSEALPVSLLEAGVAGLCLISTDVGGVRDVISEPSLGSLVPSEDYEAFAEAMIEVVNLDEQEKRLRREKIKEHIQNNFSESVVKERYVQLYRELLGSGC
ncbi:hypothetical protein BVY02_01520 [bacterium J17]|nr:hypothetical protein BVY02_01520 [bacterium J17]